MGYEIYKPIIMMIGCQMISAGTTLFVREAVLEDMSSRVLVVYRQSLAFFFIAPIIFFPGRRTEGTHLEWKTFLWIFLLSFVGVTANNIAYFESLALVSSSVASAMYNLAPVITFVMAYFIGLEKVNLESSRSIAKIIGTVVCVSGAATLALIKGPKLLNSEFQTRSQESTGNDQTWLIGCFLTFVSAFSWSLSLILQVKVTSKYKDHVSLTAWMSLMAALQSGIFTLMIEPNMNVWKLTSPLQIFCCLYAGMASAITFFARAWCITMRGPLFSAMFQPLCTVIVTVIACIFMHEELYIGSLIGGSAAIIGLYIVLWGKAKDIEDAKETTTTQISEKCTIDLEEPFLSQKLST